MSPDDRSPSGTFFPLVEKSLGHGAPAILYPMDKTPDTSPDDRWLTFQELAENRGISIASAIRLVRRKRWRRQKGNDDRVRCLVPGHELRTEGEDSDAPGVLSAVKSAYEVALAAKNQEIAAKDSLIVELRMPRSSACRGRRTRSKAGEGAPASGVGRLAGAITLALPQARVILGSGRIPADQRPSFVNWAAGLPLTAQFSRTVHVVSATPATPAMLTKVIFLRVKSYQMKLEVELP